MFEFLGVDTSRALIPTEELVIGALPQTGIPALGFAGDWTGAVPGSPDVSFVTATQASEWLTAEEPVVALALGGEVRAYPIQILIWHEVVNDTIAGVPVMISYCPLCNSAVVFDRRLPLGPSEREELLALNPQARLVEPDPSYLEIHRQQLEVEEPVAAIEASFGISGMLYNANVIMFDDSSSTLWSQLLGEAVVGTLTGLKLVRYPSQLISFGDFLEAFPQGQVLSRDTGYARGYGSSLYIGYDQESSPLFHFRGQLDERLPAKARVVALELGGIAMAFPFERLEVERVADSELGGIPLTVWWQRGTRSALDTANLSEGRDVGAVAVYRRDLDGRQLSFRWDGAAFVDAETGSRWDLLGQAVEGPLSGAKLEPLLHYSTLWFAWAAFHPDTLVHDGTDAQR